MPVPRDLASTASALCAALFEGATIEHARAHAITAPFVVEPHAHADLVQFDWIVNCRGHVTIDATRTSFGGACTFGLIAPRREHAMHLEPAGEGARVYHTRVRVPDAMRRSLAKASGTRTGLSPSRAMEAALSDVWRLTVGATGRSLLRQARLVEAIALWPGVDTADKVVGGRSAAGGLDRDLDAALALMERSLLAPPTLAGLADAACLSARQFTRRFRDAFGIAPVEFLDRKRLALAQQMLAYEASSVGEVSERMAFSSPAVFSRWFTNLAGETPSDYRGRPHML